MVSPLLDWLFTVVGTQLLDHKYVAVVKHVTNYIDTY